MNLHIEPITDPLGRNWQQPPRERILIDDTHALCSEVDFFTLLEYSASIPSGKYAGKMWRHNTGVKWFLRWYATDHNDRSMLLIHSRELLVA